MSSTQASWIILLLAIVVSVVTFNTFGSRLGVQPSWEYRIESPGDYSFDSEMEKLGKDGWELVFARRANGSYGSATYEMIFKRPKSL